jgi:hypothetical protein
VAQITYDPSCNGDCVLVVARQVISDTTFARVHQATAKRLFINLFSSCSFYEWWPGEEDTSLFTNDDVFIRHGGNICAACDGNTVHDSDLGDPERRHLSLQDIGDNQNQTQWGAKKIPCCRICGQNVLCQEIPTYMHVKHEE